MNTSHGQNSQTKTETVRTIAGKHVATIKTNTQTGVKVAYDRLGTLKARYDPRENITYDHLERAVSRGNSIIAIACNCFPMAAANSTPPG